MNVNTDYLAFSYKSSKKLLSCAEGPDLILRKLVCGLNGVSEDSYLQMSTNLDSSWMTVKFCESEVMASLIGVCKT